jgi:putative peptide zinc metalloprotease protein
MRVEYIESHRTVLSDGSEATVLKDPIHLRYYRLSPVGNFVWGQLDGTHSLKDLVMGYLRHSKVFAIDPIAAVLQGLLTGGFARARSDLALSGSDQGVASLLDRGRRAVSRLLDWHVTIARGDRAAEALRRVFYPLATVPGAAALVALSIFGLALSGAKAATHEVLIPNTTGHTLLVLTMLFLGIVIHEAAHAVATKAIGRSVNGIGVGWHWIMPVAFVDTTDSWLAMPRQRVAVTLAGPLANGAIAGLAIIAASSTADAYPYGLAWEFALLNVFLMLFNLCPFLRLDGYLALTDALGKPQLREEAFADLRGLWRGGLKSLRGFSLLSALYLVGSVSYVILLFRFALDIVLAIWG